MNDSQGKGLWPKTICVCLACGEWDRTDIQLRSFPTCHDGDDSYHGPTQTVEVLPASLSEELADENRGEIEGLKEALIACAGERDKALGRVEALLQAIEWHRATEQLTKAGIRLYEVAVRMRRSEQDKGLKDG